MWSKLTVLGCFLLTLVVVHTALRIEHLNSLSGMFLPRSTDYTNEQWQILELKSVLHDIDTRIAKRRTHAFLAAHPGEATPAEESFMGAPYSASEQNWIDRSKSEHASHTLLRWWVVNFGAAQYVIAPLAFLWATVNLLLVRKVPLRIVSGLCGLLAFGAIFLMIFRGY